EYQLGAAAREELRQRELSRGDGKSRLVGAEDFVEAERLPRRDVDKCPIEADRFAGKKLRKRLIGRDRVAAISCDESDFAGKLFADIDAEAEAQPDALAVARRIVRIDFRVIKSFVAIPYVAEQRNAAEPVRQFDILLRFRDGFLLRF